MRGILLVALSCIALPAFAARPEVTTQSKEIVVLEPQDLHEASQRAGQSMELHSLGNGSTYLYIERKMGAQLVILDVTDPAHIKTIGSTNLESPSTFDFVRDLDGNTALVCFRDNKGAAIVDFRNAKEPKVVMADALRQAAHTEEIGFTGILMVNEPRRDGDVVARDYQIVDTSDPRNPKLLTTVYQVRMKLTDSATGATYLLGTDGLTVVRLPRVEEQHRRDQSYN